ncbi:predicted protein [Uncinocarpus reesii 1704]|uniref:Fe2OG dioxygenase domain-containing protein n=1 Tax=Uncinocarpus reesii (strain UAMH 1704) TaxID=336963 RepID=C4JWT7_UNCRE|nr:uncharacterized protein UREG_06110 [Uncinocarpus reesii 1704]EEP81245.1 predicted protein [Uncinocarpus reesii 1704]
MQASMLPPDFFQHIPQISTRRALLVLDLQNDFVSPGGALLAPNAPTLIDRIPALAAHFRSSGKVFWVQTTFQRPRDTFSQAAGGDLILVNPPASAAAPAASTTDPEAFLTVQAPHPCCRPDTPGAQFPPAVVSAIDAQADTVLVKSDYSAFQSPSVLLSFRTQFITELYICGALSNISVYATALDAVRNGFVVTLVEDCLGFRRFSRHRDALRRMTQVLGVYTVKSADLLTPDDEPSSEKLPAEAKEPVQQGPIEFDDGPDSVDEPPSPMLTRALRRLRTDEDDPNPVPESVCHSRGRASRLARPKTPKNPASSTRGPGESIGSGDSKIIYDLALPDDAFRTLRDEVRWQKMYHMSGQVPRLVAVQGTVQPDGSIPIYRHPADESPPLLPFSSTVDTIRETVEKQLGHPLNHVLIQLYRSGDDRISEHSDKTLDIVRGSSICNVSLGAQRAMTLRTKSSATSDPESNGTGRQSQRVPLPHNSLFILGERTNMEWLHGIRQDKRPESTKSPEELAFNGERISLTFRHIGTFINPESDTIWGQGARSKAHSDAGHIIHGELAEIERLVRAFGLENRQTLFDWDAQYGEGFDVVNFVTITSAKVLLSSDEVSDLRVLLCLVENGVRYEVLQSRTDLPPLASDTLHVPSGDRIPIYLDSDGSTCISGDTAILKHVGTHRRAQDTPDPTIPLNKSTLEDRLAAANNLLCTWRTAVKTQPPSPPSDSLAALEPLNRYLPFFASLLPPENTYISSPTFFGIDDCREANMCKRGAGRNEHGRITE